MMVQALFSKWMLRFDDFYVEKLKKSWNCVVQNIFALERFSMCENCFDRE